ISAFWIGNGRFVRAIGGLRLRVSARFRQRLPASGFGAQPGDLAPTNLRIGSSEPFDSSGLPRDNCDDCRYRPRLATVREPLVASNGCRGASPDVAMKPTGFGGGT